MWVPPIAVFQCQPSCKVLFVDLSRCCRAAAAVAAVFEIDKIYIEEYVLPLAVIILDTTVLSDHYLTRLGWSRKSDLFKGLKKVNDVNYPSINMFGFICREVLKS